MEAEADRAAVALEISGKLFPSPLKDAPPSSLFSDEEVFSMDDGFVGLEPVATPSVLGAALRLRGCSYALNEHLRLHPYDGGFDVALSQTGGCEPVPKVRRWIEPLSMEGSGDGLWPGTLAALAVARPPGLLSSTTGPLDFG